MNDTLMACKELGFKEEKIIPIAQKILGANHITKPEQLIHLVLKEL
jgi:Holliday junction DNA helicase RuvA